VQVHATHRRPRLVLKHFFLCLPDDFGMYASLSCSSLSSFQVMSSLNACMPHYSGKNFLIVVTVLNVCSHHISPSSKPAAFAKYETGSG
jgi:hypothetical protein